jgi:hypothetical protein
MFPASIGSLVERITNIFSKSSAIYRNKNFVSNHANAAHKCSTAFHN